MVRLIALKNNIYWVLNPIEAKAFAVAAASDPVMHQKAIEGTQAMIALNIVPVFIGLIVFLIWIVDHNVERRENEKCKKKTKR